MISGLVYHTLSGEWAGCPALMLLHWRVRRGVRPSPRRRRRQQSAGCGCVAARPCASSLPRPDSPGSCTTRTNRNSPPQDFPRHPYLAVDLLATRTVTCSTDFMRSAAVQCSVWGLARQRTDRCRQPFCQEPNKWVINCSRISSFTQVSQQFDFGARLGVFVQIHTTHQGNFPFLLSCHNSICPSQGSKIVHRMWLCVFLAYGVAENLLELPGFHLGRKRLAVCLIVNLEQFFILRNGVFAKKYCRGTVYLCLVAVYRCPWMR